MLTGLTGVLLPTIVGVSILLMLMRPRDIPEVYWIGGGALLLIALRLVPVKLAFQAVAEGMDVYLFLIGMMLVSELARVHGVFHWLSAWAIRQAKGSCQRLLGLVYGIGTVVTIFMSNDATAVVLTPAILVAVRQSKVDPLPYLFACALVANAASFVLPISNPANLVVFQTDMPTLTRWLASFALPSVLSIATTFMVIRWIFRHELSQPLDGDVESVALEASGKLVVGGLVSMGVVLLAASALKSDLGLPTCLAALSITTMVCIQSRRSPLPLVRAISWETLILVAGLFVMVHSMDSIGALQVTERWFESLQHLPMAVGTMLIGFVVGVANNVVNNLPLGLVAGGTLRALHATGPLVNAVLIGVDLGPNLSVTGSLATILWLLALRKEHVHVSFWRFLQVGLVAMPLAMLLAIGGSIVIPLFFQ